MGLIVLSAYIDYRVTKKLEETEHRMTRINLAILGIGTNLMLLLSFKYYNFLVEIMNNIFDTMAITSSIPAHNLLAPLGISFYTFESISYIIDVYKGKIKAISNYKTYLDIYPSSQSY